MRRRYGRSATALADETPDRSPAHPPAGRSSARVRTDADRLWMGFSESSVDRLWTVVADATAAPAARRDAALALAQWYLARGDGPPAQRAVEAAARHEGHARRRAAFEADAALLCGRPEHAHDVAVAARRPDDVDDLLRLANITRELPGRPRRDADAERLALVNRALSLGGLSPVRMRDVDARLGLANLAGTAVARSADPDGGPTVSVIVPVRDAASTLGYALDSLTEQTYADVEIVVVDDASGDATGEVVRELAGRDDRIRSVRRPRSDGTFGARNDGLRLCTGDLVTVHDGDDWSHPEKIERQVEAMLGTGALASVSHWVRATDDLEFRQPFLRPRRTYVDRNTSSLMFDRRVFGEIGTWDEVRNFGDVEFMRRLESHRGRGSIVHVHRTVPLAFGRRSADSLTGDGPNGNAGLFHVMGSLHQYRRAGGRWHASARFPDDLPYEPGAAPRPFPAPHLLDARRAPHASPADVAVVADLSRRGRRTVVRAATVRALGEQGATVALAHVPISSSRDVEDRLLDLDDGATTRFVSSREHVEVGLLVFDPAQVLAEPLDDPPTFTADRVIVVVDDAAALDRDGMPSGAAHPLVRNLGRFGVERSEWWATDPIVREHLRASAVAAEPGVALADELWPVAVPLTDRHRGPGPTGGVVVVGVLGPAGRDVPASVRALADERTVVRARGRRRATDGCTGTGVVRDPVSEVSTPGFLARIDVAVWMPDGSGRSPAAMACRAAAHGVPVIVAPELEPVLGAAGVYATPDDLRGVIDELVSDAGRYAEQSRRGRELVGCRCGPTATAERLAAMATGVGADGR